jgi:spore coat polysaccharide biosynthesis protein SpsF
MKTGILLLGRTGSSRLPGKLLLEVKGRPIMEYQIERLKTAKRPDCLVFCTTRLPADDVLVELAAKNGLETFRGHTDDVVDRMIQAARRFQLDFIIAIGGDDVFCDPECVDRLIEAFGRTGADFLYCVDLPVGGSPFGVKTRALEHLAEIKTGGTDGWERYFKESGLFQVEALEVADPKLRRPELRMTLDYQEDFLFFQAVITELYRPGRFFSLAEVIDLIDHRPDIARLGNARAEDWQQQHTSFEVTVRSDSAPPSDEEAGRK